MRLCATAGFGKVFSRSQETREIACFSPFFRRQGQILSRLSVSGRKWLTRFATWVPLGNEMRNLKLFSSDPLHQPSAMQHFLYFLPLPQGQGSFLPIFCGAKNGID